MSDSLSLRRKTRRKRLPLDQQCPSLLTAHGVTSTQNSTSEAQESATSALTKPSAKNDEWIKNVVDRSGVEPYYNQDGIVIWNCDCRDILPYLPKVDLVLTDPPYGLGDRLAGGNGEWGKGFSVAPLWDTETVCGGVVESLPSLGKSIIWGGNYYGLPPVRGWMAWDKCQEHTAGHFEMAWTNLDIPTRSFKKSRVEAYGAMDKKHPTQKPLDLFTWCLSFVPDAQTILDPFMGSGTTLVAAKQLGKKCIGIEIDEEYCRIAVERLAQGNLFGGVA